MNYSNQANLPANWRSLDTGIEDDYTEEGESLDDEDSDILTLCSRTSHTDHLINKGQICQRQPRKPRLMVAYPSGMVMVKRSKN